MRAGQLGVALVLVVLLLRSASPARLWAMRDQIDLRLWIAAVVLLLVMHLLAAVALLLLTGRGRAALSRLLLAYGHVQAIALFTPPRPARRCSPRCSPVPASTAARPPLRSSSSWWWGSPPSRSWAPAWRAGY